ncbi:LLM class F420-dependent oxidoreductase [Streptomyces sp. NPDC059957]|uniref:LLM class F420-dependent oxidoreductase n=1 Tax=unclassified Streptomyces TaxID=2593676 RepID=UPI00365A0542
MRLGLNLRYLGSLGAGARPRESAQYVREAERLGFSVAWTAEAFSSDTVSLLGWLAAQTSRIDLGTAAMQIPARTPAMTAMTAATLDLLSEGRFRLGLGVSGPQVAEGWHGARFEKPLARTREYVDIVRMVLQRKTVAYDGEHYRLPLPDGPGKAVQLGMRPRRGHVPIYLAAVGPANTRLAGEIADGWLSVFFQPEFGQESLAELRTGRERKGADLRGFDVVAAVPVVTGGDLADCADRVRAFTTHYVGGMGSRRHNFYNRLMARTGFPDEAEKVQKLYLDGELRAATEVMPQEFLDRTALLGHPDRIADRLQAYAEAGVTTLSAMIFPEHVEEGIATLRTLAQALDRAGVGD